MKVTVLLLALASALILAADNAAIAPQSTANLQSTVVGRRSSVIGGADAITIPQMLSYQGKLTDTLGQPVPNGSYPMTFLLYATPSGGSAFWSENQTVSVRAGLFSVLLGSVTPIGSIPDAGVVYLGMTVSGGPELAPRVRIASAAYAYKADTANYALAGGTPDNAWVRVGSDSVLYTIRQLGIARGGAGNALYGESTYTHVNLGLACTTGMSGQTRYYCTVGGGYGNTATGNYATVAGGRGNIADTIYATVGGGYSNDATGSYATVGGGHFNSADASYATVGGGGNNTATGHAATVAGGLLNSADATQATVGGGRENDATGYAATVAGGWNNSAEANYATVGGGVSNDAAGDYATVAGGYRDTSAGGYSFTVGNHSVVPSSYDNSAAFNGTTATASSQLRCGTLSKSGGSFTIDHPLEPYGKILNHYFVESPDMSNLYSGSVVLDVVGRGEVRLPDYFDALNRNPRVQLTGVGTSDVFVAEDISGNLFVVAGKPGAKVYWQVTGDRKDVSAEAIRRMMPVEQPKTGPLSGRMLDDDFLAGCMDQLVREGKAHGIDFRTAGGRAKYEQMKQAARER